MAHITPQSTQVEIGSFIDRAKKAYSERLAIKLEPEHAGEMVAIEPTAALTFWARTKLKRLLTRVRRVVKGRFIFSELARVTRTD